MGEDGSLDAVFLWQR